MAVFFPVSLNKVVLLISLCFIALTPAVTAATAATASDSEEQEECCICAQALDPNAPGGMRPFRPSGCNHTFHRKCLEQCRAYQLRRCPLCRENAHTIMYAGAAPVVNNNLNGRVGPECPYAPMKPKFMEPERIPFGISNMPDTDATGKRARNAYEGRNAFMRRQRRRWELNQELQDTGVNHSNTGGQPVAAAEDLDDGAVAEGLSRMFELEASESNSNAADAVLDLLSQTIPAPVASPSGGAPAGVEEDEDDGSMGEAATAHRRRRQSTANARAEMHAELHRRRRGNDSDESNDDGENDRGVL